MSTRNQIEIESQKDPATLEREIDQQRAEISHIVDELEHKLSPGEMMDRVLGYAKGNGGEFFSNLANTVKANPVPTLLTGVGLAWLMAGQNRQPHYDATSGTHSSLGDKVSQKTGAAKEQASHMRESTKERASHMRDSISGSVDHTRQRMSETRARMGESMSNTRARLSESSHRAGESVRSGANRARSGYEHMRNEQPLALGAIGLALGALFAATLPPTRREDELMGDTRDHMKDRARQKAEEGYQRASVKTDEMVNQMRQEHGANGPTQHTSGPH